MTTRRTVLDPYADEDASRREVYVPTLLEHQVPAYEDPRRFKLGHPGRRWGKSKLSVRSLLVGHGPKTVFDQHGVAHPEFDHKAPPAGHWVRRLWKGLIHGAQISWVGPDNPQTREVWEEELVPRFIGRPGCFIKESESPKTIYVGRGKLEVVSAENIDALRGKKRDGIVVDEGAHFDLKYALDRVIMYCLIDRGGWLIMISTPEIGSYFNKVAQDVYDKVRNPANWMVFSGSTHDNKKLPPDIIELVEADFPPGSTDAQQEIYGKLLDKHGDLFKREFFRGYREANPYAVWLDHPNGGVERWEFEELVAYVDLATGTKETERGDYIACLIAGIFRSAPGSNRRRAAVLDVLNFREEGPEHQDIIIKFLKQWQPHRTKIESVQYQVTATQAIKRALPELTIEPYYPDKDKRTRAVPFAAAMAHGDVYWNMQASYMRDLVPQYLKFPNGKDGSLLIEDHDDMVDVGSMLGKDLSPNEGESWNIVRVRR